MRGQLIYHLSCLFKRFLGFVLKIKYSKVKVKTFDIFYRPVSCSMHICTTTGPLKNRLQTNLTLRTHYDRVCMQVYQCVCQCPYVWLLCQSVCQSQASVSVRKFSATTPNLLTTIRASYAALGVSNVRKDKELQSGRFTCAIDNYKLGSVPILRVATHISFLTTNDP